MKTRMTGHPTLDIKPTRVLYIALQHLIVEPTLDFLLPFLWLFYSKLPLLRNSFICDTRTAMSVCFSLAVVHVYSMVKLYNKVQLYVLYIF